MVLPILADNIFVAAFATESITPPTFVPALLVSSNFFISVVVVFAAISIFSFKFLEISLVTLFVIACATFIFVSCVIVLVCLTPLNTKLLPLTFSIDISFDTAIVLNKSA